MAPHPNPQPKLRLGTRQSPLAVAQAEETRQRLCDAHGWQLSDVELVKIRASGDKIQDRPLADIGGKALWTRELDLWLAEGKIDAAVHSMKDVETIRPDSLHIAAILPRADVRDVLVGASSIQSIRRGATIGTSAPRRAAQMLHHRPDCKVVPIRGNVATRLAKLAAGEVDVTLLAAAGLARLGQTGTGTPLDADAFLPAPAQGAIGIECNAANEPVRGLLAAIDHRESRLKVMAERAFLESLGGTCHSPIAVLTHLEGSSLSLRACLYSSDGAERIEDALICQADDLNAIRSFGGEMLSRASAGISALFDGLQ